MFENRSFTDLHQVKKLCIEKDRAKDGGIYENEPTVREGVVRETDQMMEGEELVVGFTKSIRENFLRQENNDDVKSPPPQIQIDRGTGPICVENEPTVRDDVVRGSVENDFKQELPGQGHAGKLKERFLNMQNEGPKERKPIKLFDEENAQPIVLESQPTVRDDVVRENDEQNGGDIFYDVGHTKNLASFFLEQKGEVKVSKKPIIIDRDESKAIVLENEPEVREGVVRASDAIEEVVPCEGGHTKNLLNRWSHVHEEEEEKLKANRGKFKWDVTEQEPIVLENEPTVRDDVIRESTLTEDVIPGQPGRTKEFANRFVNWKEEERKPREKIVIDRGTENYILENEPEVRTDVIRGSTTTDWDVDATAGKAKNLVKQWANVKENTPPPQMSQGKPQWLLEMEAAKAQENSGVYESQPQVRDDVVRENDSYESPDNIPAPPTKNMRNLWANKEAELEKEAQSKMSQEPQMVRFTPPREVTPPPYASTVSMQSLTLANAPKKVTGQQQQQMMQQQMTMMNGSVSPQVPPMNGHIQNGDAYDPYYQPAVGEAGYMNGVEPMAPSQASMVLQQQEDVYTPPPPEYNQTRRTSATMLVLKQS